MRTRLRYIVLALLATFLFTTGHAQRKLVGISGIVYDSATRAIMPYVSIINRATNAGTMTAENGTFTLGCAAGDTLVFTMIGYAPERRVVETGVYAMVIFMGEAIRTLGQVTVYGSYKPQGSEQWQTAVNTPRLLTNPAAPGSGYNVQTFGPGITLRGALSRYTKSEKEKRKVASIRDKAKKTEVYNALIDSEETKAFFQKTFSMTEDEYYGFIARFNATHPDAKYLENKEEIKNMMVMFKASNK